MSVSPEIPDWLIRHVSERERERLTRASERFSRLSEREQRLVTEAAVAAFVRGVMHAGGLMDVEIPKNREIVFRALDTAFSMPDLYPLLAEYEPPDDKVDHR